MHFHFFDNMLICKYHVCFHVLRKVHWDDQKERQMRLNRLRRKREAEEQKLRDEENQRLIAEMNDMSSSEEGTYNQH